MLLEHDTSPNLVYYATPCFHRESDFSHYYAASQVIRNVLFVRPRDIGQLSAEPHHIAYDSTSIGWRLSGAPHEIEVRRIDALSNEVTAVLATSTRALDDGPLDEALKRLEEDVRTRGIELPDVTLRRSGLSAGKRKLVRLAEIARINLNAQLFIVQKD